ncbi:hypothetical protein ABPG72_004215 [Tetrahymena utriculariae]
MIFGVRHGERADRLPKKNPERKSIQILYDPHLSSKGVKQAEETGKFIIKKIDEYAKSQQGLEEIKDQEDIQAIIISSPFLRAIQTSFAIAKNLKKIYQNTIFLQEDVCEWLSVHDYQNFPLDTILYRSRLSEMNKYIDESLFEIKWNFFQPKKRPRFPEKPDCADERIALGMELMKQKYFKDFDPKKYVVIYITHQYTLQSSMLTYGTKEVAENCDFCAVLQVLYPKASQQNYDKQEILIKGTNDHIKHLL